MSWLSPLNSLRELPKYPHARVRRTTFWQKTRDAFGVFYGDTGSVNDRKDGYLGLFDYLTGTLFYWMARASFYSFEKLFYEKGYALGFVGVAILVLIYMPITVFRFVMSVAATLVSLPIIAVVQGVSYLMARKDIQNIKTIQGTVLQPDGHKADSYYTLGEFMHKNNLTLQELHIENADTSGYEFYRKNQSSSVHFYASVLLPHARHAIKELNIDGQEDCINVKGLFVS